LERRALEETLDAYAPVAAAPMRASGTAIVLAALIPLCAGALYWQLGTPQAFAPESSARAAGAATTPEVEAMVAKLAARMEKSPDDGDGWALLGRSYMVMQRHAESIAAYERAVVLLKNNADVLADYADVLALTQGRNIEGKPLQLIERALKINPNQWKALAMAGSAAFERKDFKAAVAYWEKLQNRPELGPDFAREVGANIDEARQLGGLAATTKAQPKPAVVAQVPATAATGQGVDGSVTLSPKLAGKAAPTDTVFVFARAAEGPRMPLAILRFQVRDLPVKFHLDDSLAMQPAMKLSNFPDVVIGARVSKAGSAMPQAGDLQGASKPVKNSAKGIAIVIDQIVP
jgi:cytochrome c-type biogenesis protein CcmH